MNVDGLTKRLNQVIDEVADGNMSEFSRCIDTSISTIQNYSEGRWPKLIDMLCKISDTYKVNIQWLLTGFGEQYVDCVSNRKYVKLSAEGVEEFILSHLFKISQILELRSFPIDSEILVNYFIKFDNGGFLFLHVDLDIWEVNIAEITNRISFIALILGCTYLKIEIEHNDMVKLTSDSDGKSHQELFIKINKLYTKDNTIDSECNFISKNLNDNTKTFFKINFTECLFDLLQIGNEFDIKYIKSYIDRENESILKKTKYEKIILDKLK